MYCVIDIETTGGNHKTGKITEIAIIKHDGKEVVDEYSTLINPETSIPPFITRLTGISNEMVEDAPKFYEVAKKIVEITDDAYFVAHNVSFDYGFVKSEFDRLGYKYERERICTIRSSKKLLPGKRSYGLANLTKELGIDLNGHHRAYNDAVATLQIFEMLLDIDEDFLQKNTYVDSIRKKKRKPKLNKALDLKKVDLLPKSTGVYYFYNTDGEVIYIGKSKNIRARVFNHLSNESSTKANKMRLEIAEVDYEETGSELIALLKESDEIKSERPIYNRSQRRTIFHYGLFLEEDKRGYKRFSIEVIQKDDRAVYSYSSKMEGRAHLYRLCEKHNLCQNLCGLYKKDGPCFQYNIKQCQGACVGQEDPEEYNKRVDSALEDLRFSNQSFLVVDHGRHDSECTVVYVENGAYKGFGYADLNDAHDVESLKDSVSIKKDNRDIQIILKNYLKRKKVRKLIHLE